MSAYCASKAALDQLAALRWEGGEADAARDALQQAVDAGRAQLRTDTGITPVGQAVRLRQLAEITGEHDPAGALALAGAAALAAASPPTLPAPEAALDCSSSAMMRRMAARISSIDRSDGDFASDMRVSTADKLSWRLTYANPRLCQWDRAKTTRAGRRRTPGACPLRSDNAVPCRTASPAASAPARSAGPPRR